ncbi:uncharacterized protein LOC114531738 [Dendronephthya gigantea]|uniref:uncharacterized protein LOC114531738 n=1 Tax=Dendronephthya gigantea TaxID=151771 RepID=UPI00106C7D7F|nr:uncharacterized protein LOC114531738 [Dendronephthya gigantea]XP_028409158.1 uncharacterized protein LOC114531738 [Dendronephthya gigantea]XP_028409159.1 uncharacterized protein LOC114531738 [Dendronephthya gigantea]
MDTLLKQGYSCFEAGKFSSSECFFSEVVKKCQSHEPRNYLGSKEAFLGLVDVYIEYGLSNSLPCDERQDMLLKAVVMCHYVMNLVKKCENQEDSQEGIGGHPIDSSSSSEISSRLRRIEVELLRTMNVSSEYTTTENSVKHKMALLELRKSVIARISKVETMVDFSQSVDANEDRFSFEMMRINNTIFGAMKDIVQRMVTECHLLLGDPPCDYVAVSLGSFAFGTMTPYSDLEWAVLLDVEDESLKGYFRNLSRLLHFKLASLGETIVPSVMVGSLNNEQDSWFYDDVTPRGFAADGAMSNACKTPLGRKDSSGNIVFELIHSPELMAQFQNRDWLNKSFELSASLRTFRTVYKSNSQKGDEIIGRYRQELKNQLDTFVEENSILPHEKDILPSNFPDPCCLPKELVQKVTNGTEILGDQESCGHNTTKLPKPNAEGSNIALEYNAQNDVVPQGCPNDSKDDAKANELATMRHHHMKKILEKDLPRYHFHDVICTSDTEGMIYNVKKDLYRQPERLLSILFLKFGIEGADVYEGIEELHVKGFVDAKLKRDLMKSISIACELRLRSYLDHDRQLEELDIPSFIACCSETASEAPESLTKNARLDRLIAFYRVVLPFLGEVLEMPCDRKPITWAYSDLSHSPSYYNALIHLRLLRYEDAKYFSMKAVRENPANPTSWRVLARLLEKQGKYAEAFLCRWKSFNMYFYGNENIMSLSQEKDDVHEGAIQLESDIQQTLENTSKPDMHFLSRCLHTMGLCSFFSSQYQRAWHFFRVAYKLLLAFPYLRCGDAMGSVFSNIALCLSTAGRYDEAITICSVILKVEGFLSAMQVPKARDNLGNVYLRNGNYLQALSEYRQSLKLRKNYYRSSNNPFLVISLVNIANVLSKIGQVMESIEHYKEALKVIQRIYANPHASYSELCLSGIGRNLVSLGKYSEALEYCERSVQAAKKRQHRDRKTYTMVLIGLGNCYLYLKRFDDAVITYEECANIFQELNMDNVTGEDEMTVLPHEIGIVYCNLSVALKQQGKIHAASRWLQRSEEKIASCVNGESHPDMGVIFHAKAQLLRSQGKAEEAKKMMEKALEIFTKAFGSDCPNFLTFRAMIDLGNLLVSQRQFVAAIERYCEALRLLYSDAVQKDAHIESKISAHKNMGYSYYQLKKIPDAIACYKKALSIWESAEKYEKSLNDIDKSLILSLHIEAGNAYIRGGNCIQAIKLYQVAVNTPISVSYGVCDLKQVAWTLAAMQQKAGLLLEAIQSFEKAVFLHAESGREKDNFVVKCYQNQAALYGTLGDQENAGRFAEKALEVQLTITNSQPLESTAKLLAQVAEAWSYSDTQKALEFCRRSIKMIEKLGASPALRYNVLSDLGFYCHLHGLKEKNLTEQQFLFEKAEVSYNKALGYQKTEPILFNISFLFMSMLRFVEAITHLNDILGRCGRCSKVGLDNRDAKVINQELREALFSSEIKTEVVVRSVILAHCLKFQCYKALGPGDYMNARSEASKVIEYLTGDENPEESDQTLLNFALEEMEKFDS